MGFSCKLLSFMPNAHSGVPKIEYIPRKPGRKQPKRSEEENRLHQNARARQWRANNKSRRMKWEAERRRKMGIIPRDEYLEKNTFDEVTRDKKRKESHNAWYARNREEVSKKVKEKRKELTEEQRVKSRISQKKWRDNNPDKVKRKRDKAVAKVKDTEDYKIKNRARVKRWAKTPQGIAANLQRRDSLKIENSPGADILTIKTIYDMADRLQKCLGIPFHVDHRVAVKNGGSHHQRNLRALPAILNLRKQASEIDPYPYW